MDRREADAAAAVDRDPVAGVEVGLVSERVKRSHEPTAEPRHVDRRDAVGEPDGVVIRNRDVHLLGERARDGLVQPERDDVLADVSVTGPTLVAGPVAEVKRDRDLVALAHALDLPADLDHPASRLVTEDLFPPAA